MIRNALSFLQFGIGMLAVCLATHAIPVASKPIFPVADRDLFTDFNVSLCISCDDAILAVILSHVHTSVWLAGMSSEAEERARVHGVEPADGLRVVAIRILVFSVIGFAPCFDRKLVICLVL